MQCFDNYSTSHDLLNDTVICIVVLIYCYKFLSDYITCHYILYYLHYKYISLLQMIFLI